MTDPSQSIVVGMSGGVDSSVAAALLKDRGHRVTGLVLQLPALGHGAAVSALEDAGQVADYLGIPLRVVDVQEAFEQCVLTPFVRSYAGGRTPNPCVLCNAQVKFRALLEEADSAGADLIATGHYARMVRDAESGRLAVGTGEPPDDQSYFLVGLSQEQLERTVFPSGKLTKRQVRALAAERGLPVHDRRDSQDLCFLAGGHYLDLLRERCPDAFRPGPIVHVNGQVLGRHEGIASYTIGQRRRLGIAHPEPLYVIELRPEQDTVVVGERSHVYRREMTVGEVNWLATTPPGRPLSALVRIRYNHPGGEATLSPLPDGRLHVTFAEPQEAPCPGQTAAFYSGSTLLGGGEIEDVN